MLRWQGGCGSRLWSGRNTFGWEASAYGTHAMQRAVRYLGVELEDALALAEPNEI